MSSIPGGDGISVEAWEPAEALAQDAGGRELRRALDALGAGRGRVKKAMDQGVSPDEFKRLDSLVQGFDAAMRGLEGAWARLHKQ